MSDINFTIEEATPINFTITETGPQGAPGEGVPVGGTTGQVLAKASSDNYDTEWITTAAAINDLDDIPDVTITTPSSGQLLTWDGSVWINQSFVVSEADVTQHQAALSITESQISDLSVYALDNVVVKLTGDQTVAGGKTFSDRALLPFVNSGNLGATPTLSFASTQAYRGTLDANTTITVSNVADGQRASIHLYFSGAQRTIAWSGVDLWLEGEAPTAPNTGEVLVVTLLNDGVSVIGSFNIARSVI